MNQPSISAAALYRAAKTQRQIERLTQQFERLLLGTKRPYRRRLEIGTGGGARKSKFGPATRARMSAIMKRRWRAVKRQGGNMLA